MFQEYNDDDIRIFIPKHHYDTKTHGIMDDSEEQLSIWTPAKRISDGDLPPS